MEIELNFGISREVNVEDVGDDLHRGLRRVDVGVADHELLEDVVLDGPGELVRRHALLLGGDDVERQHRQHGAVHRHRHRHLAERDAVEELAHVVDRVDGHPGHPDVAAHPRVVGVVAAVGGQVERDRQALLAGGEVAPVERVGLGRGGEPGVLAHGPRLGRVHRRVRARAGTARCPGRCPGSRRRPGRRRCRAAVTAMPSGESHAGGGSAPASACCPASRPARRRRAGPG